MIALIDVFLFVLLSGRFGGTRGAEGEDEFLRVVC